MEDLANKDPFLIDKNIVIALSGGIDSVVLLHFLNSHYPGNIRAIHINHNLSKHSKDWSLFCKELCHKQDIEFKSIDINIKTSSNIEENARKKRYNSLKSELSKNEVLCTAHHQEDQSETFLLQLFRGSGVAGLASMPKMKSFADAFLYRPFLNISKQLIVDYATKNNLDWVEDDSNINLNFKRNLLRLEFIPKLESSFKGVIKNISRSAYHQSEALKLINDLAKIDIEKFNLVINHKIQVLPLTELPERRVANVLRYYIAQRGFLMPSNKVLTELISVLRAKGDAKVILKWHLYEVRRYDNELYFFDGEPDRSNEDCPLFNKLKDQTNFTIRFRQDGQRVRLKGKKHSSSLKKILQSANIPPWERDKLRMYYINDTLVGMESIGEMSEA
ncbi:tRNA lysidine(34) synthetase TilS [Candidatus Pseudothioglobus singularis]|nr:tRNA lysidine(34) synthetase TilS [Candidatus Pseudothioglobus singularis]